MYFIVHIDCRGDALGMESGTISNGQITASSEYAAYLAAGCSRLHLQLGGCHGSWTAADRDVNQWLQVDLVNKHTSVTGVATQGRNENNQWVMTYRLQYGNNGVDFQNYKQQGQTTIKVKLRCSLYQQFIIVFNCETFLKKKTSFFANSISHKSSGFDRVLRNRTELVFS